MYTKLTASGAGSTTVIAAPGSGYKVVVYGVFLQCSATSTVTLRSGTSSAGDLTGGMSFLVGGGLCLPYSGGFVLFETGDNEALTLVLAGLAPACGGGVIYDVVTSH